MKCIGIIPARAGSKRLLGKNRRMIGGRTLVQWVFDAAAKAKKIDKVVVSSDDAEILEWVWANATDAACERPPEISRDESPAIDYVRHALGFVERRGDGPFDVVAILQPSSPLTLPADIDATLGLLESSGAESAVSVVRLEHAVHPLKLKVMVGDMLFPYLEEERGRMAQHDLPPVFVRNGAVYAARRSLIERGLVVGDDSRGYVMPRNRSIDINDEVDLAFAEFLVARSVRPTTG